MTLLKKLIIVLIFCFDNSSSKAQSTLDLMWGSGICLYDIEGYVIPNLEISYGIIFYDLSDTQGISIDTSPSLWFNYNTQFGFQSFVDIPVLVNLNLGHRITNNYDVDSPVGLFTGLGYEYSYNGFSEFPLGLHGPAGQIGVKVRFWDRGGSYYGKLRVFRPINNPEYNYPILNIGVGQNF